MDDLPLEAVAGATIYTDALQPGWSDWSWSTTRNFANTSQHASGSRSISVDYSAWGALYLHHDPISTSGLTHLELDVNGGSTAGKNLVVTATVNQTAQLKPSLAQFCAGGTIPANAWTHCRVPLTSLGVASSSVDGFWIQEASGKTLSRTYFDTIAFTGASCTPETDAAFCTRVAKNCGSVSGTDNCGNTRTVASCGSCTSPQTCGGGGTANVCGDSGGSGSGSGSGGSGTTGLIADDRVTTWDPGFDADTQLNQPLGADGLPQRTTICQTLSPGANIQAAVDSCPAGSVIQLSAGTFTVSSTITLTRGVVLRGSGSQGAPGGTTIAKTGGGTVLQIGTSRDSLCYGGTAYALTSNGVKGSRKVTVGAAASNFVPGRLALIDIVDVAPVLQGDCTYLKRVSGRSVSQRVEIQSVDTATGTLTLTSPLHWNFPASSPYNAQISPVSQAPVRYAGIENLRLKDGYNTSYNGAMAGGIDISNASYCWVKDVQTDGSIGGVHVNMTGTYRCVVRDSNFHHSRTYGFGADCYGIVLRCGSADNLVENNIVRYMNKPILFMVSGGGNVVGYNYVDNSWATPAEWQEVNIDTHCSFPHMELMEGNYAPHMGATVTHGNAGYLTYFRNYASTQFAAPAVFGSTATQTGNITALQFQAGDVGMNVVGNVLGKAGWSTTFDAYNSGPRSIFQLGDGGAGANDIAATSLYRHGNFDTVNNTTMWNASNSQRTLPASFYYAQRPSWWPSTLAWPWTGPDLSPMVGTLPAKDRSDHLP